MKVFLRPTGLYSPAMVRIAKALEAYRPPEVEVVQRERQADLVLLHVIGFDQGQRAMAIRDRGQQYVILQCCLHTAKGGPHDWLPIWRDAALVWSYYDLVGFARAAVEWYGISAPGPGFRFYHSALGVDPIFIQAPGPRERRRRVVTMGHVSGISAEAIEEVWLAARLNSVEVVHVGPRCVSGYPEVHCVENISDEELASLYRHAAWVAPLRRVEGFELPAAEALCCGARPILFDQPALRRWYNDHAYFVGDSTGVEDELSAIFRRPPWLVPESERVEACRLFDWRPICEGFWQEVAPVLSGAPILSEGAS